MVADMTANTEPIIVPSLGGEISFKATEIKETWPQYNLAEAPLVFGTAGNYYESKYKAILRTTNHTLEPVAIVGSDYTLLPNEEVIRIADDATKDYNLSIYETPGMTQTHYSKSGNAWFGYYFPDTEHNGSAFEKEIVPGDSIKLGIQLRNSIDGTVGFGADSFSYRGLCTNGSIFDPMTATQVYRKHTPSLKDIIPTLKVLIQSALAEGEHMVLYYKMLAKTSLNQPIANILSQTYIPKKYLPWDFKEMPKPTADNPKATISIPDLQTLTTKVDWTRSDMTHLPQDNMWNIYNHITGAIWHNEKTNPQSKSLTFGALTKAMQTAIPMVEA